MRPVIPILATACAALLVACTERPAGDAGDPPGPAAVPAAPAPRPPPTALPRLPWPMSAIGRVNRQRGGFCSGALIAPDKVLTTARCLWDIRLRRWMAAADLHFVAGYHLGEHLAHRRARAIEVPAGIRMSRRGLPLRSEDDWAVLTLAAPIGAEDGTRPVELARFEDAPRPQAMGPLLRAGYGRGRPHAVESKTCKAVTLLNAAVLLHDCGAGLGESGFPILVESAAGWRVLGLQMIGVGGAKGPDGLGMALLVTVTERPRRMVLRADGPKAQSLPGSAVKPAPSIPATAAASSLGETSPEMPTAPSTAPSPSLISTPPGTGTNMPPTAAVTELMK